MRIKKLFVFCFTCLSFLQGRSQDIDSLRMAFKASTEPAETSHLALLMGMTFLYKNQDSAHYYFGIARNTLPTEGHDSLFVRIYDRSSALEELRGNKEEAIRLAHIALEKAKTIHHQVGIEKIYQLLGRYHMRSTQYDSAAFYWNLLLEEFIETGKNYEMWLPYHMLAEMHKQLGAWAKAKEYYDKSLEIVRDKKIKKDYLFLLYTYVSACEREGEMDRYAQLKNEYLAFKHEQGEDILNADHSAMTKIDESPAEQQTRLLKYLPYHIQNKCYFSTCDTYFHLGKIYFREKKYEDAIGAFTKMMIYADSLGFLSLKFAGHTVLSQTYAAQKDYKNALAHHAIKYVLRDSLIHLEKQKQMNELNVRFETAQKEKQLAETTLTLERVEKNQQLLSIGLAGAILIIGLVVYTLRMKRKTNMLLEEKNKRISRALEEKDILLREIHHRVKNNLQMISALLYLHGKSVDDTSAQEALMESQNRVQSMAMIHQNLYQEDNLLGVSITDYLDKLLQHLISSYNIEENRITIQKKIDVPQLDIDTVIPLALIINELISNALKYAFRDGRKGEIIITLEQKNGGITLGVNDNGMGLPEHFSLESSSTFGLKLINILCDRLGATWSAQSEKGTRITLVMPNKKAA